jgi:hypothetical protein
MNSVLPVNFGEDSRPCAAFKFAQVLAGQGPLVLFTAVSFRAAQFDAGTVAGVQWLLMVVFV